MTEAKKETPEAQTTRAQSGGDVMEKRKAAPEPRESEEIDVAEFTVYARGFLDAEGISASGAPDGVQAAPNFGNLLRILSENGPLIIRIVQSFLRGGNQPTG